MPRISKVNPRTKQELEGWAAQQRREAEARGPLPSQHSPFTASSAMKTGAAIFLFWHLGRRG